MAGAVISMSDQGTTPEPKAGSRDHEPDVYGPDSFPASDPPGTWWGGDHDTPPARRAADAGSAERAARRGPTGETEEA